MILKVVLCERILGNNWMRLMGVYCIMKIWILFLSLLIVYEEGKIEMFILMKCNMFVE